MTSKSFHTLPTHLCCVLSSNFLAVTGDKIVSSVSKDPTFQLGLITSTQRNHSLLPLLFFFFFFFNFLFCWIFSARIWYTLYCCFSFFKEKGKKAMGYFLLAATVLFFSIPVQQNYLKSGQCLFFPFPYLTLCLTWLSLHIGFPPTCPLLPFGLPSCTGVRCESLAIPL